MVLSSHVVSLPPQIILFARHLSLVFLFHIDSNVALITSSAAFSPVGRIYDLVNRTKGSSWWSVIKNIFYPETANREVYRGGGQKDSGTKRSAWWSVSRYWPSVSGLVRLCSKE